MKESCAEVSTDSVSVRGNQVIFCQKKKRKNEFCADVPQIILQREEKLCITVVPVNPHTELHSGLMENRSLGNQLYCLMVCLLHALSNGQSITGK